MNKKKWLVLSLFLGLGLTAAKQVEDYFEVSKNLDIFSSVYKEVNLSYVDEVKPGQLIRVAIDAMLKSLDPYTNFYSEAQAEDYLFQVTGSYGGIGAVVKKHGDNLVIDRPYLGYPAQEAGLRSGDIILKVDGKSVEGKSSDQLSDLLKGNAGSAVVITINRPLVGELDFNLVRAQVKVKNVPYYGMVDEHVGYIKLTRFTPDAGKEVYDALKAVKEFGAQQVILDLRGNGGGLLHEAVNIVNVFVDKGQLVVTTKGKVKENDRVYKTLNTALDTEIPLVVLIDENSASASEIVSGTIQDLDRGVVVGTQSFGKGLVQTSRELTYHTQMKITTAKYYIPSGRCIQRLDYAHKENGSAISIADSLKQTFLTKNGRKVTDGEGVNPDVIGGRDDFSKIAKSLIMNDLIFDYATIYRVKHDSIEAANKFELTASDFEDFKTFLSDKEYGYETDTEKSLVELKNKAKDEAYLDVLTPQIEALELALQQNKDADLDRHKAEILELLETEIAARYYYDEAFVITTFDDDNDIAEAIKLFHNSAKYNAILTAKK